MLTTLPYLLATQLPFDTVGLNVSIVSVSCFADKSLFIRVKIKFRNLKRAFESSLFCFKERGKLWKN